MSDKRCKCLVLLRTGKPCRSCTKERNSMYAVCIANLSGASAEGGRRGGGPRFKNKEIRP